jgi:hypothetical protein
MNIGKVTVDIESTVLAEILSLLSKIDSKIDSIQPSEVKDKLYTSKEVEKLLFMSAKTLQNRRNNGDIGFVKSGAKIYYRTTDIDNYLNKHQQKPFNY